MTNWFMVTLVGHDQPGIVAKVTAALFKGGCNLGETSMMRLGGNFAVMLMASTDANGEAVEVLLAPVAEALGLRLHVDAIAGELHRHVDPDVRITVAGADRAGIVAQVTGALAAAGLDITDLESDVGGDSRKPIYILHIEGVARDGIDALNAAVETLAAAGVDARLHPIDTLMG